MINTKGEWIYTNSEIAYEIGVAPATINAIGKRLFGNRIPHWNIQDVKLILEYIKSISIEEDSKRLRLLHDTVIEVGFDKKIEDADDLAERVKSDLYQVE